MKYSEKLLHPNWQKKRLAILQRDNFTCTLCGDTQRTLHVHHQKYDGYKDPWMYEDSELATLCKDCHLLLTTHGAENLVYKKVYKSKINRHSNTMLMQAVIFGKNHKTYCISLFAMTDRDKIEFLELLTEVEYTQTLNLVEYINTLKCQ